MLRSTRPLFATFSGSLAARRHLASSLHTHRLASQSSSSFPTSTPGGASQCGRLPVAPLLLKTSYATQRSPGGMQAGRDPEEEKKFAQEKLEPHPESVTTESSVRHVYEPATAETAKPVGEGVKHDLQTVKETFALSSVPKESYVLGLAGTIPYLATSISTVYLSWDLNTTWPSTSNFANHILISHDSARHLLGIIEPIQLGYGAVIISFLGAIHWGLEYAERKPLAERTRFRYGLGVMSSVVAWPTLLMPMEFALTSQFAAFVALYFADSRAAVKGWAPSWYGSYRFVLTAVVGVAIIISLIGRAKVGDAQPRLTGLNEKFRQRVGEEDYDEKWAKREEEDVRKAKAKQKAEEKKKQREEQAAKQAEQKNQRGEPEEKKQDGKSDEGKQDGKPEEKKQEDQPEEKKQEAKSEEKKQGSKTE